MNGYVYAARSGSKIKIGYSASPPKRLKRIEAQFGQPCVLLGVVPATIDQERQLHKLIAAYRIEGEWYNDHPVISKLCGMLRPVAKDEDFSRVPKKIREFGTSKVARALGITHGAVHQWVVVPAKYVLEVERVTGLSRHELRPDLYPATSSPPALAPDATASGGLSSRVVVASDSAAGVIEGAR